MFSNLAFWSLDLLHVFFYHFLYWEVHFLDKYNNRFFEELDKLFTDVVHKQNVKTLSALKMFETFYTKLTRSLI